MQTPMGYHRFATDDGPLGHDPYPPQAGQVEQATNPGRAEEGDGDDDQVEDVGADKLSAAGSQEQLGDVLEATNFGLPVERGQRFRARRAGDDVSREHMGATHHLVTHAQTQEGDPAHPVHFPPHGVPPDLPPAHIDIMASAPWLAAVPGTVFHAAAQSRTDAFEEGLR